MSVANDIDRAVALLQAGELVGIPTETVYGLGADAANPAAVARIFAAKGRPADHPLIVHLAGHDWIERWARDVPELAWDLAEQFWPGPLTLILKRAPGVPDGVTGGQDTVGLRVPGHPLALDLLRAYAAAGGGVGGMTGIAAPSANRFGRISPTTAAHVREELGDRVALVLDGGACPVGIESTIIDLSRGAPVLLRPGHIRPDQIEVVTGCPVQAADAAAPRASGTLESHYAPSTPLRLVEADALAATLDELRAQGKRAAVLGRIAAPLPRACRWLQGPADPTSYAHDLYANLRQLDGVGADFILIEAIPPFPEWIAVADRLRRAAA